LIDISGKDANKYDFRLELVTIPLDKSNNLWNFLYAHVRMDEGFYEKNRNISKPTSPINMAINHIIFVGLNYKRPTELGFNYNEKGLVEVDARILKGHDLEEFIKDNVLKK
jgi:hypothetical protein